MASAISITDGLDLVSPARYERGYPHETWSRLRRESPVHRCEPPGYGPFWAITRHADICDISKRPDVFLNAPGIVVLDEEQMRQQQEQPGFNGMKTIIEMDPPAHRSFRKVASGWFTPRSLARLESVVEDSARSLVDSLAEEGDGECDFVTRVAAAHPLRILSQSLGVPRDDEPYILRLTNELFSGDDPEFQREAASRQERFAKLGMEFFDYFSKIIADRRANPRDDLASVLANASVDGAPMGPVETLGYYLIVFTAGHDTTRNAISGGMLALLENEGELARLRRDPSLAASAVEEIVRWTTPVNYMKRTAARDVELRGRRISAGDELMLCYASANRDEEVFDEPFSFRIDRSPNRHLGFGIGEHFCLGAHLARRSQTALFGEIARRVERIELAGEPERTKSSFVAGIKHLPVRYRFS
jgi:cytochrome P450